MGAFMTKFDWAKLDPRRQHGPDADDPTAPDGPHGRGPTPPHIPGADANRPGGLRSLVTLLIAAAIVYGGDVWFVKRVVVPPGKGLVLMKKDGARSLPGDQVVIPRAPDAKLDAAGYDAWDQKYGDCNGIMEEVYPEGTYFGFSPFDYDREVKDAVVVPNGSIGVVVKKFGERLDPGQVLADPARNQRGPLAAYLQPARYNEYSN